MASSELPTPPAPELAPWRTAGVVPLHAPPEKPEHDHRFRPHRLPEAVPEHKAERSWKAIKEQCSNGRVPGYTGFIPSQRAEDVFGHTQADVGKHTVNEQARRRANTQPPGAVAAGQASRGSTPGERPEKPSFADDHPLGKSRSEMVRNHWVPTIPGYGGYVPGKYAENVNGGGMTHTCRLAGRAIAERNPQHVQREPITIQDYAKKSRMADYYHASNQHNEHTHPEKVRLASDVREHCGRQIPGYMGHVPRIHGESIYGGTARNVNMLAADFVDDRAFNPDSHQSMCCKPQVPKSRQLRF